MGTFAILETIWGHFRDNRNYINDMFHSLRTHVMFNLDSDKMVMHIGNFGNMFGNNFEDSLGTMSKLTLVTISR